MLILVQNSLIKTPFFLQAMPFHCVKQIKNPYTFLTTIIFFPSCFMPTIRTIFIGSNSLSMFEAA